MVIEIRAKGLNAHWRSRVLNVLSAQMILKFRKKAYRCTAERTG